MTSGFYLKLGRSQRFKYFKKETIIGEEEIIEELFYNLRLKKAFVIWTQDPEVRKKND